MSRIKGTVSRWCACSKPHLLSFKKTIELSHWRDKISSRTTATARDSMFTSSFTVIFCLSRLERLDENAVSRRHGSSWRGKANILDWLYFMIFSFHWFFMSGRLQEELSCRCKSTCSTKSGRIRVGCPCKTANKKCTSQCSCGTRQKPCKNKATVRQLFIICRNKRSQYSCSVYK